MGVNISNGVGYTSLGPYDPGIPSPNNTAIWPIATGGSVTTAQAVNSLINYLQQYALNSTNMTDWRSNLAAAALNGSSFNPGQINLTSPSGRYDTQISVAPSDIVRSVQSGMQMYPVGTNYTKNIIDGLSNSWIMRFFPAATPGGIDTLLQAVTQSLVPEALQEIMWSRAKAQGMRDNARFEDEQVTTWASRGFSLPSGVLANQLMMKQQQLAYTNADLAAQQAVKALDIQIDGIKFAAELSVKFQLGLIEGMNGLINAYSRVPISELDHNAAITTASNQLYGGVTAYYDTLLHNADAQNRYAIGAGDVATRENSVMQQAWSSLIRETVAMEMQSAQVYAQITNAALGGLHGVASASVT